MSVERDKMIMALKSITVPLLRSRGFKGSFPHFSRKTGISIDLFSFQFSQFGGQFVVEVGVCPADGWKTYSGDVIPPNKVRPSFVSNSIRLGSTDEKRDYWFVYDNDGNLELNNIANKVNDYFLNQAEEYFKNNNISYAEKSK